MQACCQFFVRCQKLEVLLKVSQILYAETLVKTLAHAKLCEGSFVTGRRVMEQVFAEYGIPPSAHVSADGSV